MEPLNFILVNNGLALNEPINPIMDLQAIWHQNTLDISSDKRLANQLLPHLRSIELTSAALVTPYGDSNLDKNCLR